MGDKVDVVVFGEGRHHVTHERTAVLGLRDAGRSHVEQEAPGNGRVQCAGVAQERELPIRVVLHLERGGIDGDKARDLAGEDLHVDLRKEAAHGLANEDRVGKTFLGEDLMQQVGFVIERPYEVVGPGCAMGRRIPDKAVCFAGEVGYLRFEKAMIGGKTGEEHQIRGVFPVG